MMSRMTASSGCVPMISSASRPPGHLMGSMPSMRSLVSTSSAMMGWSSTIKMRGFCSDSAMALGLLVTPARSARQSGVACSSLARSGQDVPRLHACRHQAVEVPAAQPAGAELALHAAFGGDAGLYELEQVLDLDLFALHADDLADAYDLARAVGQARHLDECVDGGADLLPDRLHRELVARHQHHHLDALQALARRAGVDGGERAVVAGVHRLQHVERLATACLADDDAVGPHAERVAHQVALRDLALAVQVGRTRLERDHVGLLELELGRVLDRHHALVVGDEAGQAVEEGRLPGARPARDG